MQLYLDCPCTSFPRSFARDFKETYRYQCESRIKKPMTLKNINLPLTDIQNICERWHIKELALFGSALRSDFHPESDRVRSPLSFPSS
jgi:hypothetical protein